MQPNLCSPRYRKPASLLLVLLVIHGLFGPAVSAQAPALSVTTWDRVGELRAARTGQTATLLPNGKVLVAGGVAAWHPSGMAAALATAELYDPSNGIWYTTGSMLHVRANHTATLLPNGKVLVAGGEDNAAILNSAELYDPAAGTWSSAASLAVGRNFHSATLLQDGRLLAAGGWSNNPANSSYYEGSVEIYDPTANTWSATGSLGSARFSHTASLLQDGQVLVVGGEAAGSIYSASVELYDPATGKWTAKTNISPGRFGHTATALPDGRVLVSGGRSGYYTVTNSAQIFDPAGGGGAGTWSAAAFMSASRIGHSSSLLPDGQVLVVGGSDGTTPASSAETYDPAQNLWTPVANLKNGRMSHSAILLPTGRVLVTGGLASDSMYVSSPIATSETYDFDLPGWSSPGDTAPQRACHTVTLLLNGSILVTGGVNDSSPTTLATTALYNPMLNYWVSLNNLHDARQCHTATLLRDGRVLVTGGLAVTMPVSSAEIFDPMTLTWSLTGSLHTARYSHSAALLPDGRVLVVGGYGYSTMPVAAEIYDPNTGQWTVTGSLALPRAYPTATLLPDGRVLVIGGLDVLTPLNTTEIYAPASGTFSAGPSLVFPRYAHTATLLGNGYVLVTGGFGQGGATVEMYAPPNLINAAGVFFQIDDMSVPRALHSATLLPDGRVLITGGKTTGGPVMYHNSAELFDPAAMLWRTAGSMPSARARHSAIVLYDGRVLLVGGTSSDTTYLATSDIFDVWSGLTPYAPPSIYILPYSPTAIHIGLPFNVTGGGGWRGLGGATEGSSGATGSSPTNYPLLQLYRLDNGQVTWVNWTALTGTVMGDLTTRPLSGIAPGPALLRGFVNGMPSSALPVMVEPARVYLPVSVR